MSEQQSAVVVDQGAQTGATELPQGAAAPLADGVATGETTQQTTNDDPNAPAPEGQAKKPVPEDRTARFRFTEITRERNQAQIEAAEARAEARTLRSILENGGKLPSVPGQPNSQHLAAQNGPPDPTDFERYPLGENDWRFAKDMAKFELRQEQNQAETKKAADAEFEAGRARFIEVVKEAEDISAEMEGETEGAVRLLKTLAQDGRNTPLIDQINATDNPVWIAETLARNPKLRAEVFAMNPIQRGIALGRMDGDITRDLNEQAAKRAQVAPSTPQPQPTTQANGRGAGPVFNPEKADTGDYIAARQSGRYV